MQKTELIFQAKEDIALIYLKSKRLIDLEIALSILNKNPCILWAEPDYISDVHIIPDDTFFIYQWGMRNINAASAWNVTTGGNSTVIGIIDSGIDFNHPDLTNNISTAIDFIGNDPRDLTGHGTHIAGTIGAVGNNALGVAGICWQVSLVSMKVGNIAFDIAAAIKAINYANENNITILNASWGTNYYSLSLKYAIDNYNGLVVASSGNSGVNIDIFPVYPASFDNDNILTVGASDRNNNIAGFSNYGINSVDILAPGVDILSTEINDYYTYMTGTSMSAPQVAGLAGLIKTVNPELTPQQIKSRILSSSTKFQDLSTKINSSSILNLVFNI